MFVLDKNDENQAAIFTALDNLQRLVDVDLQSSEALTEEDHPLHSAFQHEPDVFYMDRRQVYGHGGLPHRGNWRFIHESSIDTCNLTAATTCIPGALCRGHMDIAAGCLFLEMCAQSLGHLILATKKAEGSPLKNLGVMFKKHGGAEFPETVSHNQPLNCFVRWMREPGKIEGMYKPSIRHYGVAVLATLEWKTIYAVPLAGMAVDRDTKKWVVI